MSSLETKFTQVGTTVRSITFSSSNTTDSLVPKVYQLCQDIMGNYYLEIVKEKYDLPKNLFGTVRQKASKVINTYESRNNSTGILLVGEKGFGKTLLAEVIGNEMLTKGVPVILVNSMYVGDEFNTFINTLGNVVFIFDEFSRVYKDIEAQGRLLTVLDGTFSKKRLFIFTDNNEYRINEFMKDRPGRIYYKFVYSELESKFITDYCKHYNVSAEFTDSVLDYCKMAHGFSVDALKAVVEEHHRYGEQLSELIRDLNVAKPSNSYEFELLKVDCTDKTKTDFRIEYHNFSRKELELGYNYINESGDNDSSSVTLDKNDIVLMEGNKIGYRYNEFTVIGLWITKENNYNKLLSLF